MEGWRKMMLLMVLAGDDMMVEYELRALLARDEAAEERRKLVRKLAGEKRAEMAWKRGDCMAEDVDGGEELVCSVVRSSSRDNIDDRVVRGLVRSVETRVRAEEAQPGYQERVTKRRQSKDRTADPAARS